MIGLDIIYILKDLPVQELLTIANKDMNDNITTYEIYNTI